MAVTRDTRVWALYLVAGVAATAAYFAFARGGTAQAVVYDAIGVSAAVAIAAGVRRIRPAVAGPWLLFALGNLCFAVADVVFNILVDPPVPSVADGFYLAGYPLLAAGLAWLLVRSGGHHRTAGLTEAAIVTAAFATCQWVFVLAGIARGGGSVEERLVAGAYPAMDVLLLAGLAGFFVTAAWRTTAFRLLVGSIFLLLIADEVYGVSPESYRSGTWVDALWLLSYVLWGTAALHPTMRELSRPRAGSAHASRWRLGLLTAALATAPTALLVQWARGASLEAPAVFAGGVVVSVLVTVRLAGIVRLEERARALAEGTQRELERQNERLVEADRLKDEFVALISHDLRTPLTSIMGYVELALDEGVEPPLDAERKGYLEVVSRSSGRLLRLVDDLLFVARLQAGKLVLERSELDLAQIAAQAVEEARPRAESQGLALAFSGDGPVVVDGDRGRVFQLLDNLLSNALKFTPAGGSIDVRAARTAGGGAIEVSDTGIGLSPHEQELVFDRFFRSTRAVHRQVPGSGLGLFIARAIVDAHGGSISASSREGGGTTFRLELPARATHLPAGTRELVA